MEHQHPPFCSVSHWRSLPRSHSQHSPSTATECTISSAHLQSLVSSQHTLS